VSAAHAATVAKLAEKDLADQDAGQRAGRERGQRPGGERDPAQVERAALRPAAPGADGDRGHHRRHEVVPGERVEHRQRLVQHQQLRRLASASVSCRG
jgi:hypothetical protein